MLSRLWTNRTSRTTPIRLDERCVNVHKKIKLEVLFKVFMDGPLFGKSVVAKTKSDIEKQVVLTEQMKFQSIIEDILIERTYLSSVLKIFRVRGTLETNEKMTNKESYFKQGKKLFQTFCTQVDEFSRMFPACPANQEYIDIHRNSDAESKK